MKKIYLCLTLITSSILAKPEPALIIAPIVDAVGAPIQTFKIASNSAQAYEQLPFCGGTNQLFSSCPRLHQLRFNQIVTIEKTENDQAYISISDHYFIALGSSKKQCNYWIESKNLKPLAQIPDQEKIPHQISTSVDEKKGNHNLVVLIKPWQDRVSKKWYSIGTRFTINPQKSNEKQATINLYDAEKNSWHERQIARNNVITPSSHPVAQLNQYRNLLHEWAQDKNGSYPYVLGGCSLANTYTPDNFEQKEESSENKKMKFYSRPHADQPKSGVDCARLILLAAQTAGLPYYFSNTTTLAQGLDQLLPGDQIHEGDLIWVPGHVMAVGNLEKNTLIEARGYSHGYGVVHEIPLNKVFKGIDNYDKLKEAYFKKQPLLRIDKSGTVADRFAEFKIVKMASIFKKPSVL